MIRRVCFLVLTSACLAQVPDENQLREALEHKVVSLKVPAHGEHLRYDLTGKLTEGSAPGAWEFDSKVEITAAQLAPDHIAIECNRLLVYLKQTRIKDELAFVRTGKATIRIDLPASATESQVAEALHSLFLSPGDDPLESTPAEWRRYVVPQTMGPQPQETSPAPYPAPGVFRVGGDISAPKATNTPEPEYTDAARKARVQGVVLLRGVLDEAGRVNDVQVVRPLGGGLDRQAIDTIRRWTFDPAHKQDGTPVKVMVTFEVKFDLDNEVPASATASAVPPK